MIWGPSITIAWSRSRTGRAAPSMCRSAELSEAVRVTSHASVLALYPGDFGLERPPCCCFEAFSTPHDSFYTLIRR